MPFIRFGRDKRGYESTYVMHAYRPAQGPQRTRLLYLFRSPAHVRVGREPLDAEVREALEHTHPDLSFDWQALLREPEQSRERVIDPKKARAGRRPRAPSEPRPDVSSSPAVAGPREPPPAPLSEDQTLLGEAVGRERAARLRAQYSDLLQRIARRSRTPEDRDRLVERARRLNPDDWVDAAEARARIETIEAEWSSIAAELPARRRGRRGGRRRASGGASASVIIEGDHEKPFASAESGSTGSADPRVDSAGDGDRVGSDATDASAAAGDDVSGDN